MSESIFDRIVAARQQEQFLSAEEDFLEQGDFDPARDEDHEASTGCDSAYCQNYHRHDRGPECAG